MLYVFGFEKIGVVFGDLYLKGSNGEAQHGVRVEVRLLDKGPTEGTKYGSRRISVVEPIWRADILETVDGVAGSLDRVHHHPAMHNWNNGPGKTDPEFSADPIAWFGKALTDIEGLLDDSDFGLEDLDPNDGRLLAEAAPEICAAIEGLLHRVQAGELGTAPDITIEGELVRTGWM